LLGIARNKLAHRRRRAATESTARRKLGMPRLSYSDEALERVEEELDATQRTYTNGTVHLAPAERAAVVARVIEERGYNEIAAAAPARRRRRSVSTCAAESQARPTQERGRMNGTRHVETDALAALRAELTRAAARRAWKRRPARRAAAMIALATGLLGATGAAAALTDTSTGLPAVDELLSIEKIGGRAGLPSGDATEPITVQIGDGSYQMIAYFTRGGQVRIAFAEPNRGGIRGGGGGGWSVADLARRLERRAADLQGATHGPSSACSTASRTARFGPCA
jgi:hypothetical protein